MTTPEERQSSPGRSLLVWRAIRWRAGSSAMFFLVAVAAIMAAAAGPIYLRAADQSLVTSELARTAPIRTGLTLSPEAGAGYVAPAALLAAASSVPGGVGAAPALYRAPIVTIAYETRAFSPVAGRDVVLGLLGRTGSCAHLHIVSGHCPTGPNEVALSTRSARDLGTAVGKAVPVSTPRAGITAKLQVVGLYTVPSRLGAYWWQQNPFAYGTTVNQLPSLDAGFMSLRGASSLPYAFGPSDFAQLAIRPGALPAPSVPALLGALSSYMTTLGTTKGLRAATHLPVVLATAERQESSAGTIIAIISLQLVLLVLFVLYAVAKSTNSLRAPDVQVAELRGHSRKAIFWLALREPILLLLAALPVGILLSYLLLSVIDGHVLGAGATTVVDSLAAETAVFGCVGGVVAAALGSWALLSGNSFFGSGAAARQQSVRNAAILDALGLALAAAGVAEMAGASSTSGGAVSPLAYLGPGLLALGGGILAARLVPLLGRLVGQAYSWSKSAAVTLAARSLARRDLLTRQVLVPSIATGLLVFGVAGLSVVQRNQDRQAAVEVGAPYVLHVAPAPGVDLLSAVRRADPSGREAMAVAEAQTSSGDTLMVDARRFAAIASWPAGMSEKSPAEIGRLLDPPLPPARMLPAGDVIAVTVTTRDGLSPGPVLSADVFGLAPLSDLPVSLGRLRPGTHTYSAPLFGLCPAECRLDSLSLSWPRPRRLSRKERHLAASYSFRLDGVVMVSGRKARPGLTDFSHASGWQSPFALNGTAAGLVARGDLLAHPNPQFTPVDLPATFPAVATPEAVSLNATAANPRLVIPIGLDGSNWNGRAVAEVPAIPRLGSNATMIDLGIAYKAVAGSYSQITFEVWCKHAPTRRLLTALGREKVRVLSLERAATLRSQLGHSGPAFGFDLYGLAALAAAVLALGALLFSVAATTRGRRIEFASLSAVGIPRASLLRSLLIESTAVSLTGTVVGTAAAVVSASLALSFLPEFPPGRVGPPLLTGLPWEAVALTAAAMFVLLEAAGLVANILLVRGIRPDLMRLSR